MSNKIRGSIIFAIAFYLPSFILWNLLVDNHRSGNISSFFSAIMFSALLVFNGVSLFNFDKVYKLNALNGFKIRSKQSPMLVRMTRIYGVLTLLILLIYKTFLQYEEIPNSATVILFSYLIPFVIFAKMSAIYATPFSKSKKYFINTEEKANEYLYDTNTYTSLTLDNFVIANDKILFFPKYFCVIPFENIKSTRCTLQIWGRTVCFYLTNGKKLHITTNHCKSIKKVVDEYMETIK